MFNTENGKVVLEPEQVQSLLIRPMQQQSIAAQVSTVDSITTNETRFPIFASDPQVGWTEEGAEIQQGQPDLDEVVVKPTKVAGLFVASRELFDDTNPQAINEIGGGLVRQISNSVDAAFFGALPEPAAPGLETITPTEIDGDPTDVMWADHAASLIAGEGTSMDSLVCHPTTALGIASIRESDGSNRGLLQPDATASGVRTIGGTPLLVSTHVTPGTVWAIPRLVSRLVIRQDAEVTTDTSAYFSSDRIAMRATMRVGFGFTAPEAIVKVNLDTNGGDESGE